MRVDFTITAFHKGRIQVRVCKVLDSDASEASGLTEACLNQNVLTQVAILSCFFACVEVRLGARFLTV
jgi:hypothetical protein